MEVEHALIKRPQEFSSSIQYVLLVEPLTVKDENF